jgi:hypothetical protein
MPPAGGGEPLNDEERRRVREWIEQGALVESHWALIPPQRHAMAADASRSRWVRNEIDRWILAKLQAANLAPNEPADRRTLIRRVSLDLTGLPPTPTQLQVFLNDSHPLAYERLVDSLLASPAFGERWARVWLDLARYADSAGYAQDPPRNIYRYRDWVIDAWNSAMPFDQFTREQLAGDLLPDPTTSQLLATAFHRNTMTNSEGGTDDEEFRSAAIVDRVNTTWQVWMGLTMGCAQCHTHKYDPITQAEYFRSYAIFNNTADADRGDESPNLSEYSPAQQTERARLQREIEELDQRLACLPSEDAQHVELKTARDELVKQQNAIQPVTTPIMEELKGDQRRATHVHVRGNFLSHGERVEPGVPEALIGPQTHHPSDRLEFANWLLDTDNPLTARVTVNRCWEQLFGTGLVETSEDFGIQGDLPSHPELLDNLAIELIQSGWDIKRLLRHLVTSATYLQSSDVSAEKLQRDPANRLLARAPSYRLSAEMIRDQSLAIGGLLSHKMHGPSVFPTRPNLNLRAAFGGSTDWETSPGEDAYRRGLYTSWRRTTPYPSFATFDAPSREVCTLRRIPTNTPLQAFVTLNDPAFFAAAQGLAVRVLSKHAGDRRAQIEAAFELATARRPEDVELQRLIQLADDAWRHYEEHPEEAQELKQSAARVLETFANADQLPDAELATMSLVANIILNLDEVLTKK